MPTRLIVRETEGNVQVLLHRPDDVAAQAAGQPSPFGSPLTDKHLEDLQWYLERYLQAPYAVYESRGQEIHDAIPQWGEALFEALFGLGKPGRDAYKAVGDADCELLVQSNSPAFLGLPWEILKEPSGDGASLLAFRLAGITRTLHNTQPAAEATPGEELRVLMVIARPEGTKDVNYQMVARPLLERLEAVSGKVRLDVLRPPTIDALRRRLAEASEAKQPYHILHFDGHGTFGLAGQGAQLNRIQYQAPQGYLVFENDTGQADAISADDFARVMRKAQTPLLVLNACRSGQVAAGEGPEAAVATRLLQQGVGAVVAMGYSVYAVAAAEFMAAFYEELFRGAGVTRAVAEGRAQLRRNSLRPSPKGPLPLEDWMVPVHYAVRDVSFPHLRREAKGETDVARSLAEIARTAESGEQEGSGLGAEEGGSLAARGKFFGRDDEFLLLERALRTQHVALIHGVGGTGKTELAKAFARWLAISGGAAAVRFTSFEPGLPSFGLDGVLTQIGLGLFGPNFVRIPTVEARRAVFLRALREHPIFLVWDNFETACSLPDPQGTTRPLDDDQQRELRGFLGEIVRDAAGGVIITSRSPETWLSEEIYRIELLGLGEQDAAAYADHLLGAYPQAQARRQDRAYADLLEFLGGHPLSLRLTLPRLGETDAEDLLASLKGQTDLPLDFEGDEQAKGEHGDRHKTLSACVYCSFQHLSAEDRRLLPALTLFEGVADVNVLGIFSGQEDVPERFGGQDASDWRRVLDGCAATGLLTGIGGGMYVIQPALPGYLTALWRRDAGEGFETEHAAARHAIVSAYAVLGAWLLQQILGGEAQTAMAVLTLQRRTLQQMLAEALGQRRWEEAQNILQPLDKYWEARGLIAEAQGWTDRIRAVLEDPPGRPPDLSTPAGSLWLFTVAEEASRAMGLGDLDTAVRAYDALRQTLESMPGDDARRRCAVVYHQLGAVAQHRGDLSTAEDWYRKSLEIEEALDDRPGMAASYHQLGMVAEERGDLAAAEDWYRKSLEIKEALGDRPGMATSYHQLGVVAQKRGDVAAAEDWYRKSLEIEEALGRRPGMASSYHQLGMVARDRGDLTTAEEWYRKALEIYEDLSDRPHMATVYHQLGIVAQDRGDLTAAEEWYRKSLEINEALGNRPSLAITYAQMGLLNERQGRLEEALSWCVRSVSLFLPEFPSRQTGTAPVHVARLTGKLGMDVLAATWQRVTGRALPENVRAVIPQIIEALDKRKKQGD